MKAILFVTATHYRLALHDTAAQRTITQAIGPIALLDPLIGGLVVNPLVDEACYLGPLANPPAGWTQLTAGTPEATTMEALLPPPLI